jgi:transcription initiation factor TFIID subunit 6
MRHAKRKRLTPADINHALKVRNVEPLYGYNAPGDLQFQYLESQDLFFIYDEEIALDELINAPLPVVPLDVTVTAHWLAVEGVQPAIPQNPIPDRAMLSEAAYGGTVKKPVKDDAAEIKQLVKNVLTKELQIYYEKITDAIMSDDQLLQKAAFASLYQDPGIQPLTPYFVQFASEKVLV